MTPRLKYLRIILALTFVSLGLVGLYCASVIENKLLSSFFDHLSAAFLVVGLIAVFEKVLAERELLHRMQTIFLLGQTVHDAGIWSAAVDSGKVDFTELIAKSRSLSVVLNDGHKWVSQNFEALRKRFGTQGTDTRFFLLDSTAPFVDLLAEKIKDDGVSVDVEKARIKDKIDATIRNLANHHRESGGKGSLVVFTTRHFPTYSLFLGDDQAIVTMYSVSGFKQAVPTLCVRNTGKNCLHSFFERDVIRLEISAKKVLTLPQQEGVT
jgi:hypothetical protein